MRRYSFNWLAGFGIGIIAILLMLFVWPSIFGLMKFIVRPGEGMDINEWIQIFRSGGLVGTGFSCLLFLLWYFWGLYLHPNPEFARMLWWTLQPLLLFVAIAPIFFFPSSPSNVLLVYLCYALNSLVPFYVSTVFFSPPATKFAVPGSEKLREILERNFNR